MLTPVEHRALLRIADGLAVERPVRRRLVKLGMVDEQGRLTEESIRECELRAPRSKWEPPRQQGPQQAYPVRPRTSTHPSLMLASMLMMAAASPRRS